MYIRLLLQCSPRRSRTRVLSLVLPTAPSLLPCDYTHILPELFVNLYYFGAPLRPTLYKVWGKSEEVMTHTGLLTIDRNAQEAPFTITHLIYAPRISRPLGVQLPIATTICGCNCAPADGSWIFQQEYQNGRESIFSYRSSCCRVVLHVAIFPGRRRMVNRNDMTFVEEDWNPETRSLDFKESTMVRMKVYVGANLKPFCPAQRRVCTAPTNGSRSNRQGAPLGSTLDYCGQSIASS
jgi:hypothetical protein